MREYSHLINEIETVEQEKLAEFYVPNGICEQFIKQVGSNKHFVNLFKAANGVGKTAVGAMMVRAICFGPPNFDAENSPFWKEEYGEPPKSWFDFPLFQEFPYTKQGKRGRIVSDPTTIKEQIVPELKKWFPSNRYKLRWDTRKEGKQYECKWQTDTGWEFDLMTYEQAAKEFESVTVGWLWFDEPPPHNIYTACVARMRMGGIIIMTLTPLDYSAWVKDEIVDKRDGKLIEYLEADVEDNCVEHGVRGILEHKNIERMMSQWSEDEIEARAHGQFGHLIGRIFKKFSTRIHKIKPFAITYNDYCVVRAVDTHPREPDHISWAAINRKNQKFVIDELAIKGTDGEIAAAIKNKEKGWRIIGSIMDPSGWNEDKRGEETSFAERLENAGLMFDPGSKELAEGIRRTQNALDYEEKDGKLIREPEIYFFETCSGHIKQFSEYVWDEWTGKNADQKKQKDKPKDFNDHYPENIRRILQAEYRFAESEEFIEGVKRRMELSRSVNKGQSKQGSDDLINSVFD